MFATQLALAVKDPWPPQVDPEQGLSTIDPRLPYQMAVRNMRLQGKMIPENSRCEQMLVNMQMQLKEVLTHEKWFEIVAYRFLDLSGERLVDPPAPQPRRHAYCFTGEMRVLTQHGERPIQDLKVGDEVLSVDVRTGDLIPNRITSAVRVPQRSFCVLLDVPRPLNVTLTHLFLSRDVNGEYEYKPIEAIVSDSVVRALPEENMRRTHFRFTPRGRLSPQIDLADVYELTLENEPHNYVIEGLVVHNMKALD